MSKHQLNKPIADLHTPEELLLTAQELFLMDEPQVRRAVVLEAITALEAFVKRTVFGILEQTLDPLLVKWLEEKTRMDLDSRLSVLTPFALARKIDTSSQLWANYKEAKSIRNRVTHLGKRISQAEARFVLDTVYDWLAYLGSTAEISLALLGLKRSVESSRIAIPSERVAIEVVRDYFNRTSPAKQLIESLIAGRRRADIILQYGQNSVVIEVKRLHIAGIEMAIEQVASFVREEEFTRGALVVFTTEKPPELYTGVRTDRDGLISIVVIEVSET